MKRTVIILTLLLVSSLLSACTGDTSIPSAPELNAHPLAEEQADPSKAGAATVVLSEWSDRWTSTEVWFNECTGEELTIDQEWFTHGHLMYDPNGRIHYIGQLILQERATGPSGADYVGTSTSSIHANVSAGGPSNEGLSSTTRLVSKGSGDNFSGYHRYQFVINANGDVTVDHNSFYFGCAQGQGNQ